MNTSPGKNDSNMFMLIERYENMVKKDSSSFFDSHEFEDIADYYIDKGLLGEAMESMDIAFKQYPFSGNFLIKKAQVLTILERLTEAVSALEFAETLEPNNPDLYIAKGSILSKKRKHQKALRYFQKAQDLSEEPLDVYPFIAFEYQCLGNFDKAIKYLILFLEIEPEDDIAIFNIAYCFERLENYNEAIYFFLKLTNKTPYCEIAWYQLGLFYNKLKDYKKAIWALDYAIIIDSSFTASYHEKARSLTKLGEINNALKTYLQTIEIQEPSGYTYLKIALCYKELSMYKQAIRYLTKATREDPQLSEAWMEMGLCLDEINSTEEGLYYIEKAISLNPDDLEYLYIQTKIYKKIGLIIETDLGYKKLIDLGCNSPTIWLEYADLIKDMNEIKDAISILKQSLTQNKKHPELLFRLGAFLFMDKQIILSKKYLQQAYSIKQGSLNELYLKIPILGENEEFKKIINSLK
jgi:tetratricopeptide (TPR) repeat protein